MVLYVLFVWQIIPAWLSCLPIKGDLIEAKVVHELLCSMVESTFNKPRSLYYRSDIELLGPNNQYVPKIVSVFTEVSCVLIVSSLSQLSFIKCANRLI
ncbi:putative armadillo-like helical protein [Helianthus annuus]|uniref:Armadillo-like helical, importin beta family n=1 Tax=Helianthus annuus TaxID=4232 RepID=A0A251U9E3_HELAN|nr:putative armadillo-like helical, importin beta family [Helianthus annuus]KAJ0540095.1 putative armadillo-like helical, importin beta family [Helianthus annuus]KAJ0548517.1 putative armadillo-like helical protein [Helianthus annuus]KAJ0554837.1 putative armadillo-like helical, importin beta family [Helianthus annuus]KAJ0720402.1 putative armadillo-like helical, importin beta family [Helianthus annuus]